ncbi:MICOS complex subunit MIC27 [Nakaseomyces bracarensis]|uniref:MICOS complex subunit MIC27 n=1 Tax=Nakaseomyces bracarensis TaxID=273131 RepID=A0ABR4NMU7_9SACH
MVNYYGDTIGERKENADAVENTKVFEKSKEIPTIQVSDLPNGNKILQVPQVTEFVNKYRQKFLEQYGKAYQKFTARKELQKEKLEARVDYVKKNILVDDYETKELLVPVSILSLGAFLTGRIITNPSNWGRKNLVLPSRNSLLGVLSTNFAVRLTLPLILSGYTFSKLLPVTWDRIVKISEHDLFPKPYVQQIKDIRQFYYEDGVKRIKKETCENVYRGCERGVHHVRKFIIDQIDKL